MLKFGCYQLRVTAARPGVVNFELDIRKEHTVSEHRSPRTWTTETEYVENRLGSLHGGTIASMGALHFLDGFAGQLKVHVLLRSSLPQLPCLLL